MYWDNYISDYRNIYFTDVATHDLINKLLLIGDEQLSNLKNKPFKSPVTGQPLNMYEQVRHNNHFRKEKLIQHEYHIHAVMDAIKPGLCAIFTKKFTKEMMYQYLK